MKRVYKHLSVKRLLQLLRTGVYRVEPNGDIYGQRGKKLAKFKNDHSDRSFVRLHDNNSRCGISVARLVWMSQTKARIPVNFEVHHRDNDETNDDWQNLTCLHKLDHKKEHNTTDIPF